MRDRERAAASKAKMAVSRNDHIFGSVRCSKPRSLHVIRLVSCPAVHTPGGERWWFDLQECNYQTHSLLGARLVV